MPRAVGWELRGEDARAAQGLERQAEAAHAGEELGEAEAAGQRPRRGLRRALLGRERW